MTTKKNVLLTTLGLLFSAQVNAAVTITDLGTLGGSFSWGYGINNTGQVTGGSPAAPGAPYHAYIYNNGTMQDLGAFSAQNYSYGNAINNSQQVVGAARTSSGYFQAFLYSNGVMNNLGTFGGSTSEAYDINDQGVVVGGAAKTQFSHAFVYSNGIMQDLALMLGGAESTASGINNAGQITGNFLHSSGTTHTFLYSNGTMQDLGTMGGKASYGEDINDNGQMTGWIVDNDGSVHSYLYSDGLLEQIKIPGMDTYSRGMNNAGQVVGDFITGPSSLGAFLYSDGVMYDLNDYAIGTGWILSSPGGINDYGQIVGTGNLNGEVHAYMISGLTPVPLPGALPMMMGGLSLFGLLARRRLKVNANTPGG